MKNRPLAANAALLAALSSPLITSAGEIETTVVKRYQEQFRYFAVAAALLLLLEIVLRYTVLRAIP